MSMYAEDFDVSAALKTDPNGHVLREIKNALESAKSNLKKSMDKGLSPDKYTVANNLHKACQTARDLVEQFWSQPRN
jgi:type III secretion system YseE family protein